MHNLHFESPKPQASVLPILTYVRQALRGCLLGCCSYKVEGEEQTAQAELRGLKLVTQINLGKSDPNAPSQVGARFAQMPFCVSARCQGQASKQA